MSTIWKCFAVAMVIAAFVALVSLRPAASNPQKLLDRATAQFENGDLSAALHTLKALNDNVEFKSLSLLLTAKCNRRLGRVESFRGNLDDAREFSAASDKFALEDRLLNTQLGGFDQPHQTTFDALLRNGASKIDAGRSVVLGCLVAGLPNEAETVLRSLKQDLLASSHLDTLEAAVCLSRGDGRRAEEVLRSAIGRGPQDELAYLALAELYASPAFPNHEKCALVLQYAAQAFPENTEMVARVARAQRLIGDSSAAARLILARPIPSRLELLELADAESDCGRFTRSRQLFEDSLELGERKLLEQVDHSFRLILQGRSGESSSLVERVNSAALALALGGKALHGHALFAVSQDRVRRVRRMADIRVQLPFSTQPDVLAKELNALRDLNPQFPMNSSDIPLAANPSTPIVRSGQSGELGSELFEEHCAQCHGSRGEGQGRAARLLSPRPRNFVGEPLRYVSSTNRIATDEDLRITIKRGLLGTSMPGFSELTDAQVHALIETIRGFRRVGLIEQQREIARQNDVAQPESPERIEAWIASRLQPDETIAPPEFTPSSPQSIELGQAVFARAACASCHAVNGDQPLSAAPFFDSLGHQVVARHLGREPLRRGFASEELYRRIVLGIPGTPHPGAVLTTEETIALVHYLQQVAPTGQSSTNHQRWQISYSTRPDSQAVK